MDEEKVRPIIFKKQVKPVWVDGSIMDFDSTEIGGFDIELRKEIMLKLKPLFPGAQREFRKLCTEQIFIQDVAKALSEHRGVNRSPQNKKAIEEALLSSGLGVREKFDEIKYNEMCIDHVIEDWKGFVGEEGQTIQCIKENKTDLFYHGGYSAMGLKIVSIAVNLAVRHDLYEMELEKNLPDSQDSQLQENGK